MQQPVIGIFHVEIFLFFYRKGNARLTCCCSLLCEASKARGSGRNNREITLSVQQLKAVTMLPCSGLFWPTSEEFTDDRLQEPLMAGGKDGLELHILPTNVAPCANERWMEEDEEICRQLTPFEFCFPGTHDTGACNQPTGDAVDGHETWLNSAIRYSSVVRSLVGLWTVTQSHGRVYDQLRSGTRFLDLRVAAAHVGSGFAAGVNSTGNLTCGEDTTDSRSFSHSNRGTKPCNSFVVVHTFVVGVLSQVIADIIQFIREYPKELIFVCVAPYYEVNCEKLRSYVTSSLKDHICPARKASEETVRNIVDGGHNVILMWTGGHDHHTRPSDGDDVWLQGKDIMSNPWRSIRAVDQKQTYLHEELAKHEKDVNEQARTRIFQLAYTLTPGAKDILTFNSVLAQAERMNRTLCTFLQQLHPASRRLINIISVDNLAQSDVVSAARRLLRERLSLVVPVQTQQPTSALSDR